MRREGDDGVGVRERKARAGCGKPVQVRSARGAAIGRQSIEEPRRIDASLARSRALVWAVSVQRGQLTNVKRDLVLNTLVRNAGGRREFIFAASAVDGYMRQYAAALSSQYQLTYRRTALTATMLQVGVRREGARVIAGSVAPQ